MADMDHTLTILALRYLKYVLHRYSGVPESSDAGTFHCWMNSGPIRAASVKATISHAAADKGDHPDTQDHGFVMV